MRMNWLAVVIFAIVQLAAYVYMLIVAHERGRKKGFEAGEKAGYRHGYEIGQLDADDWWIRIGRPIINRTDDERRSA